MRFRFMTWNLNWFGGTDRLRRKMQFMANAPWDVAALQEVPAEAVAILRDSGMCDDVAVAPRFVTKHGCVLLARNGWEFAAPALMAAIPVPERGIWAVARREGAEINVGTIHVTNAADGKSAVKRAHYVALIDWLQHLDGDVVLGGDFNHAFSSEYPDLPDLPPPQRHDDWKEEYLFFSSSPPHALRDAWFDVLRRDRDALRLAAAHSHERPSAYSYAQRRRKGQALYDRMDYILVSTDIGVEAVQYDYEGGRTAGSDHGAVHAELTV
jgi:endonuclease/exonuclease/phosphatase family metal-dependent hydrolase